MIILSACLSLGILQVHAQTATSTLSTVKVYPSVIPTGGKATITVQLKDVDGNNLTSGGATIGIVTPTFGSLSSITDNNDGTYTAIYTAGISTGNITITPTLTVSNVTTNFPIGTTLSVASGYVLDGTSGYNTENLTFTTDGGLTLGLGFFVDYLIVAGGGGGGGGKNSNPGGGGGGGGGGVLQGIAIAGTTTNTITVGSGGAGSTSIGNSGGSSTALGVTAKGGGGGAGEFSGWPGNSGASGGGGGGNGGARGTGTLGQGFDGGAASLGSGSGGGGSGAAGVNASGSTGGAGGNGKLSSITGTDVRYGGGGGGGTNSSGTGGSGGTGGGGSGGSGSSRNGSSGSANTGGGGGGAAGNAGGSAGSAGSGAAGVVILRYYGDSIGSVGGTVTSGTGSAEGYTLHRFTSTGAFNLSSVNLSSRLGTTLSNAIGGNGNFTFNGPGRIILPSDNTYIGNTTIASDAILRVGNGGTTGTLGSGDITNNGSLEFFRSSNYTLPGIISGTGTVVHFGDGDLNLGGYSHSSGTWRLAGGAITNGTITTGDFTLENGSISAILSGSGTLTKTTSGTVRLTGTNTYLGITNINGGTLFVNGNHAGATGAVTVMNGGTLGGTGTLGGSVTAQTGSTLSAGDGVGTLTTSNHMTLASGSNINWQLEDATGVAGTDWDLLNAGGILDITATSANPIKINLWSVQANGENGPATNFQPTLTNYKWKIASASGGITGFAANKFKINASPTNGAGGIESEASLSGFSVLMEGNDLLLEFTPPVSQTISGAGSPTVPTGYTTSTSAGSLTLNLSFFVDYLVVGGGGAGGYGKNRNPGGGGGGGGGAVYSGNIAISTLNYPITVGSGGTPAGQQGGNGSSSSVFGVTAAGGGGGAGEFSGWPAGSGSSGGGGGGNGGQPGYGTLGEGFGGGAAGLSSGSGGGGAGALGANSTGNNGGAGGVGKVSTITGSSVRYGGGGGGGTTNAGSGGSGGSGGGGAGGSGGSRNGTSGSASTGGGGGGAAGNAGGNAGNGGAGGSGVVILRYRGNSLGNVGGTITQGTGTASGYTFHTFTSSGSFDLSSVDLSSALSATVNNAIVGNGDLIYNGPGVLALTATNTYSGTTTIAPSATLQIGRNSTLGSLGAGAVTNDGTLAFNRSDTYTLPSTISGSGNVVQYGPGELNLAGSSHNAGGWRLAGGSITSGTMASGDFTVEDGSISAVLAGSGTLTKSTSGVVTLTGTNTYSGATTVSAGTLLVNGNHSAASGAISVNSDASLGGIGTVGGAMTVNTGGTVSPGDGLGTFTVNNNVTFAAGGQMNWQITDATGSAGTGWDMLTIAGSLNITATSANPFKVNLWSVLADGSNGPIANYEPTLNMYTWTLATTTGGVTGFDASDFQVNTGATNGTNGLISSSSTSGYSVILSQSGKDLLLQWSPPTSQVLDGTSGATTTAGYTTTTSANSLTLTNGFFVDYLIVGGGGGGGGDNGGGGGAGGLLTNVGGSLLQLNTQNYTVTVGSGGNGGTVNQRGSNGGNSSLFSFTAMGGGGGSGGDGSVPALAGGSGGGGNGESGGSAAQGANRTAGQGYSGGTANFGGGAGGGGAGASGRSNTGNTGGAGGIGLQNSITGTSIYYAGGGGGGPENGVNSSSAGGQGGGGEGKPGAGTAGAANTGGGGGGAGWNGSLANGGAGGSGIVIVRYEGESVGSIGGTITTFNGNGTIGKSGVSYQVHSFTSSGSFDLSSLNLSNRLRSVLSGGIVGSGDLIFNGPGVLALTASNTYSGTTTIASGSILQIGNGGTTGTLGGGSVTNNGTLRFNRTNAFSMANAMSGSGSFEKLGTGTLTLTANSTYAGGTKVSAGTMALGIANALPTSGDLTVEAATFNLAGFNQTVGNVTLISGLIGNDGAAASLTGSTYSVHLGEINAALAGTATLTKTTTGTVTLSGTNTYSGATNVNAGTLRINGNNVGATGALTVASGATLAGSGTIGGAITAQSGAILAPGNSAGILTAVSDLTLATGASFQWELVANDATPADRGTDFDGVNVSGALSVGTAVTSQLVFNGTGSAVDFTDAFWKSPHTWLVFDNANAPTLASPTTIFDTVTPSVDKNNVSLTSVAGLANARFYWTTSGNDLILNYYSGVPSTTTSTVTVSPSTHQVGNVGTSTLTIQLKESNGNNLTNGGATISFASLGAGKGSIGTVFDNNNGTYTATYTAGTTAGAVDIIPTIGGVAFTQTATITLTAGAATATLSTASAFPTSISVGGAATSTITVQLRDVYGNPVNTGGGTITFDALGAGLGTIGSATDNNNGTFSALYTAGTTLGLVTITPKYNGISIGGSATLTLTAGSASAGTSTVTVSPSTLTASGTATSTITVQLKDGLGNVVTSGGESVTFVSLGAGKGSIGTVFDNNNGTYSATYTAGSTAGPVTIIPKLNGTNFTQTATITLTAGAPTQLVIQAGNNQTATVGTAVAVAPSVKALDANNNPSAGVSVTFAPSAGGSISPATAVMTGADGIASLTRWTLGTSSGTYTLTATITGSSPTISLTFTATGTIDATLLSELNTVLSTASALDPSLYTPGSWSALTAALALPTTTNAEVAAKTAAIKAALAALITKVAQAALDAAVTAVGALNPATYTPASWAAQQGPLAAAMALPATTNAEILAKTAALNAAMAGLITKTAQSTLDTVIDTAGKLTPASYSPTSWSALTAALALPAATNAQVLAKTAAINAAMASLIIKETQQELDAAITATGGLNESDYTPQSWKALSEALALPARNNAEALAKAAAIKAALSTLVTRDTQSALEAAITAAGALDGSQFTPESWKAITAALALPASTKAEMDAKTAAINKAIALLITKSAQSALDTATAAAAALNKSAYSPESWNALQAALALPATTNAEVLAKAAAIQAALEKLTAAAAPKMSIQAGEGVSATVGTSVSPSPSVVIKNAYNEPVAGVEVTFTVSSGDGVVEPSRSVITGTDGIATLASWTLGLTAGKNTLVATAMGINSVTFTATGTTEPGKVATVQVIHNSPIGLLDVGLNGMKLVDDIHYQTASRQLIVPAQTPVRLQVTSANGDITQGAMNLTGLTARKHHLLILQGGADGKPFEVMTVSDARIVSTESGAAQVIFHHGVTNGPIFTLERVTVTTPRRTEQLIASFAEYGSVSTYSTQMNPGITQYQLRNGSTLLGQYLFNNMGSYEGKAVTLLATGKMGGFLQNALNLMMVDAEGRVTKAAITTANQEEEATLPLQFTLYANYPNPFNPTTTLRFDLPEQAKVRVEIMDVLGRQVMTLAPQTMSAGTHKVITLDVADLPSGTYFYRVIAEGASRSYVQGSRFTLLK